eukprot:PLAT11307.2.p1 GENE.PLAT11307.2~~PLAT11307.2.p1  ORF type:complete len:652 (-),score=290.56 PLAT11307.2:18-1973(-)
MLSSTSSRSSSGRRRDRRERSAGGDTVASLSARLSPSTGGKRRLHSRAISLKDISGRVEGVATELVALLRDLAPLILPAPPRRYGSLPCDGEPAALAALRALLPATLASQLAAAAAVVEAEAGAADAVEEPVEGEAEAVAAEELEMAEDTLVSLATLLHDDYCKSVFMAVEQPTALLTRLFRHPRFGVCNASAAAGAAECVWLLAQSVWGEALLAAEDTELLALLLEACRAHRSNGVVLPTVIASLWALIDNDLLSSVFVEAEGPQAVLLAMQACSRHVAVLELGVGLLQQLVRLDPSFCPFLLSLGAAQGVADAMNAAASARVLQQHGSSLLAQLSLSERGKRVVVDEGGFSALLAAMEAFPRDNIVQQYAALALCALAAAGPPATAVVRELAAVRLTLTALQLHNMDARVQELCMGALRVLAWEDVELAAISEHAGIARIVHAMSEFPRRGTLQEFGCGVLCSLSFAERNREAIMESGAIACLVAALHSHPTLETLQRNACATLLNVSLLDSCKPRVVEEGGLPALMACSLRFPTQQQLQELVAGTLWNLSRSDGNKEPIVIADGVEHLLHLLSSFPKSPRIAIYACAALRNLGRLPIARKRAVAAGALELLRSVYDAAKSDGEDTLQDCACSALDVLSIPAEDSCTIQ